ALGVFGDTVVNAELDDNTISSRFERASTDVVWKAPSYKYADLELSKQTDRPMTHEVGECNTMVKEKNYQFDCFQGEFVSTPETRSMYRCEFGAQKGRLFFHTFDNYGEAKI
ncbi:hypothetical protein PFISCL1PPCAC_23097, partial [Pristionchus fissidentatus]